MPTPSEPAGTAADADAPCVHVHDTVGRVPDRLPGRVVRELSRLEPGRALGALATEWLGIAAAVAAFVLLPSPVSWALYPLLVVFIGARQHALAVLGHDAAHYRFLPKRALNDWLGNLWIQWPIFISVEGFRRFHGKHHRHTGGEDDGNRFLWKTHDAHGHLSPEWQYPKTTRGLILKIVRRMALLTGLRWILRGLIGPFFVHRDWLGHAVRVGYYGAIVTALVTSGWWVEGVLLWIVPYCTWHIGAQYMRLIAEHSAIESSVAEYAVTRSTIPTWWEGVLILPRNIGYHIEHHWYPSVPFYNLPALHARLMEQPGFREHAVVEHSLMRSLRSCATA